MQETQNKPQVHIIGKSFETNFTRISKYYKCIFEVNDLPITQKEVDFLSYLALNKGTFTTHIRESFSSEHKCSKAAIYNMTSKLRKYKILLKSNKKIVINPEIYPDFDTPNLILQIKLITS